MARDTPAIRCSLRISLFVVRASVRKKYRLKPALQTRSQSGKGNEICSKGNTCDSSQRGLSPPSQCGNKKKRGIRPNASLFTGADGACAPVFSSGTSSAGSRSRTPPPPPAAEPRPAQEQLRRGGTRNGRHEDGKNLDCSGSVQQTAPAERFTDGSR
jgi:hypothetical protein